MISITRIVNEHKRRTDNNMPVPAFLQKEIDGINLTATNRNQGLATLIAGLHDERDHIDKLLEERR